MRKLNIQQTASFAVAIVLTVLALFLVYSCDTAKQATKHHKKAEKLGYIYKCDTTYIDVPKIVKGKDGKDSLIYVPTPCNCPEIEAPKTQREIKWKYKYDLKQQKARDAFVIDSMTKVFNNTTKHAQIKRKSDKTVIKNNTKTETANNKSINIALIVFGIVGSLVLLLLLFIKFKK
jgi:hypothetical protein